MVTKSLQNLEGRAKTTLQNNFMHTILSSETDEMYSKYETKPFGRKRISDKELLNIAFLIGLVSVFILYMRSSKSLAETFLKPYFVNEKNLHDFYGMEQALSINLEELTRVKIIKWPGIPTLISLLEALESSQKKEKLIV